MANNLSAWFMWYLLIAVLSGSLVSSCGEQKVAYTGDAEVKYLTPEQMKVVCPLDARACSYVWSNGQCFIYVSEAFKDNPSWNYTLLTHEYLHCTGQIPPTQ